MQGKKDAPQKSATEILRNKISAPLKTSSSSNNECDIEDNNKRYKSRNKKKEDTRLSQFNLLTDSKAELVNLMKEDLRAKSEIEMQILNMQLKKEKLEVELLEKEMLIKNHILEREIQKENFFNN